MFSVKWNETIKEKQKGKEMSEEIKYDLGVLNITQPMITLNGAENVIFFHIQDKEIVALKKDGLYVYGEKLHADEGQKLYDAFWDFLEAHTTARRK